MNPQNVPWTDEELTELECVIDTYCQESVARGKPLRVRPSMDAWCPLWAVVGYVGTTDGMRKLGLEPNTEHNGFWHGFDGWKQTDEDEPDLYAMGQRFRERTLAGEYSLPAGTIRIPEGYREKYAGVS